MTFQNKMNVKQAAGVPGEFYDNSPRRTSTYKLKGQSAVAQAAGGVLTFTGNLIANDTITIGTQTYKFVAAPAAANDVLLGADEASTIENLIKAINLTGTEGTDYGTGTSRNAFVSAEASGVDEVLLTALLVGPSGNSVATTTDADEASFGAATLTGGSAAVIAPATIAYAFTETENVGEAIVGGDGAFAGIFVGPKQHALYGSLTPSLAVPDGTNGELCRFGVLWVAPAGAIDKDYIGIYNTVTGEISGLPSGSSVPAGFKAIPNAKFKFDSAAANGLGVLQVSE